MAASTTIQKEAPAFFSQNGFRKISIYSFVLFASGALLVMQRAIKTQGVRYVLDRWRRDRAVDRYIHRLPALLRRDYGASACYTPAQVRRTIERSGLNTDYSCFAVAMFSDRAAFDRDHAERNGQCDYDTMRAEIAARHFSGHPEWLTGGAPGGWERDTAVTHHHHDQTADIGGHHHGF